MRLCVTATANGGGKGAAQQGSKVRVLCSVGGVRRTAVTRNRGKVAGSVNEPSCAPSQLVHRGYRGREIHVRQAGGARQASHASRRDMLAPPFTNI